MLQLQYIKEHTEEIIERLKIKNVQNVEERIAEIIALDEQRRALQQRSDVEKAQQNAIAKEIGRIFQQRGNYDSQDYATWNQSHHPYLQKAYDILIQFTPEYDNINVTVANLKEIVAQLKASEKELMEQQNAVEADLNAKLISLPNAPHITVPKGKTEADNVVVAEHGAKPDLPEGSLPHWELCAKYDIVDFELGNKITGAGFPVYKGKGARLQRALIDFFLNEAADAGYVEIMPPLMVNEASGLGTGQLPDKEGQMYAIPLDGYYMIPTAEVPITNIYRNAIVTPDQLPIKHVGYSECFRREAGSYGKDVRGLNRLHEFSKVEIVVIEHPDRSYDTLEEMKLHVGGLLDKLGLPYHILKLCGGDISFTSAMTFDFEVWSAAQQKWLEVSSVSNFETFQANRMKLRFKDADGKMRLAHTLNGSALALPRIVAALLENNQTPDGIVMPECLRPYLGFDKIC